MNMLDALSKKTFLEISLEEVTVYGNTWIESAMNFKGFLK